MRSFSKWIIALCASPLGVPVLAALDSTLFFSLPFGIDAAVVLLSARLHAAAWIVPLLATAGSIVGAWLTFWMGQQIGEKGLDRFVDERRLDKVRDKIRKSGAFTLAVLDFIPPPFPFTAFVLAAGALEVRRATFFVTLAVVRIVRFGAETALAVHYGSSILGWMNSDLFHDVVFVFTVLALLLTVLSAVKLVRSTRDRRGSQPPRAPGSKQSDRRSTGRVPA
jgi:membrane protein YqaA with SNARE-associated domain